MFRTDYIKALGGWNEEVKTRDDMDLLLRYMKNFDGYHLRIPFYRYNIIWDRDYDKLRELGVVEAPLFPVELPWTKAIQGIVDNSYKKDQVPSHPRPIIETKKEKSQ